MTISSFFGGVLKNNSQSNANHPRKSEDTKKKQRRRSSLSSLAGSLPLTLDDNLLCPPAWQGHYHILQQRCESRALSVCFVTQPRREGKAATANDSWFEGLAFHLFLTPAAKLWELAIGARVREREKRI